MSAFVDAVLLTTAPEADLAPGVYAARAQDPAYGWLEAMVATGQATLLGEKHEPDGTKLIAVSVPGGADGEALTANMGGTIRIGREFFTTALRDYHDWQEKWWREGVQNAVDAGATEVECSVTEVPEGYSVAITDNGRGMDEDTLLNKFLVLGGTTKTAGTTRGGFGKAKELLVLPWLAWSVHTRDRKVVGVGMDYQVEPAPYRGGTELRVVMPADQTTHPSCAIEYISKCYLPSIHFTVNGELQKARLRVGEEIRTFGDKAVLYYDKNGSKNGLFVRTMGLFMFDMYVSSSVPGTLLVELTGSSIELLTANRDGFREPTLRRAVESYVNELAANVMSALKKKKGLIREKFVGTGKFTGAKEADLRAEVLNHLEELQPAGKTRRGLVLSDGQREVITTVIQQMGGGEGSTLVPDETPGKLNMRASGELASAMLDDTVMTGPTAVEAAVKQLAWEPDFYLVNEVEGFHVPKMFYPEHMTPGVKKLGRAWAELCRFVLIQLGCALPYGVGFIFDTSRMAEFNTDESGDRWLLLNPYRDAGRAGYDKPTKDALYGVVTDEDVNQLYALAIHECTHMADGVTYHDEAFSSAFTRNVAKTANKDRQVKAIIKAIKARGPRGESTGERKPKKPKGLRPLADETLERRRVESSKGYGTYSVYVDEDRYRSHGETDLPATIEYARVNYTTAEIRDPKTGKAVWRTEDFRLPLADSGETPLALPELRDDWLATRRRDNSRLYSGQYVSFKDAAESAWDYARSFEALRHRTSEDAESTVDTYFEIRDPIGVPVWRSRRFPQDALQYAENQSEDELYLEGPLGQGAPWTLYYGREQAVLSEFAAVALAARYDIPIGSTGRPGEIKQSPLGLHDSVYDEPIRISKKAQRLLAAAGIEFAPNQFEEEDEDDGGPHSWKPNRQRRLG